MAKIRPLPMPVDLVLTHRAMFFCSGATYKVILAITCHFWAAGCPSSDLDDESLASLARTGAGRWQALKTGLKPILAELLPKLAHEHAVAQMRRDNIRTRMRDAAERGRATMAKRRMDSTILAFEKKTKKLVTPDTATRYVNPRAVMRPDKLAAIGKLPTDKTDAARFSDK